MGKINDTVITRDDAKKQMKITHQYDAPPERVWKAWTDSSLLDQWWAPKPWKAQTKSMDFRPSGTWLYAMVGPQGDKHWAREDYGTINAPKNFSAEDSFCDENGVKKQDMPSMHWDVQFTPKGSGTNADVTITFPNKEQMDKTVEMGFKEGFTAAQGNLDELLEKEMATR